MKARGVQWYYYLLPKGEGANKGKSLFATHPRSTLINKFIVCWDYTDDITRKKTKLYGCFDNYLNFALYFLNVEPHLRSFFEIILGERMQKPHFDIDMDLSDEEIRSGVDQKVLDDLINTIVQFIPEINIEKDVCIYSSHADNIAEKKNKRSYHIIINHFFHANNKEAKAFYYAVMGKLPKEYFDKSWIDHSVYSKTQQFRTYLSKKIGTDRTKIFLDKWTFNGQHVKHIADENAEDEKMQFLINLEESIVSARPGNCKPLPNFTIPDEFIKNKHYQSGENVEYDLAMEAISLLAHSVGTTVGADNFPYSFDRIDGPFVVLKRRKASKCRLCNRVHQKQNPYLLIVPENKNVFFHCRRAPQNKNLFIGCLATEAEKEECMLKSLEVVEGNVNTVVQEKKHELIKNNWTEEKIKKLREIAAESVEKKDEVKKKGKKKMDGELIDSMMKNILQKKRSQ